MTALPDALAPVRQALLAAARADADAARARAHATVAEVERDAARERERLLARARADGAAEAAQQVAARRARAREQLRAEVLQAQERAHADLLQAARDRAQSLVTGRPDLPERLGALARRRLGDGAQVSRVDGAVVGELGSRRWVWSSDRLADEAVRALGPEVERLWTS